MTIIDVLWHLVFQFPFTELHFLSDLCEIRVILEITKKMKVQNNRNTSFIRSLNLKKTNLPHLFPLGLSKKAY